MSREIVIFDTEYTSWEGAMANNWGEDWQEKEIVQIAAIKCNMETMEIVDELDVFIKALKNPVLSDFFTELTGITNNKINECGVSFEEAYDKFVEFAGDLECFSFGWNLNVETLADGTVMNENLELLDIKEKTIPNYINIAPWFKDRFMEHDIMTEVINSGKIAKHLGIELSDIYGAEHNALFDTYSLWEGVKYFKAKEL